MKIRNEDEFNRILGLDECALEIALVPAMGGTLVYPTAEKPAYYTLAGEQVVDGVWLATHQATVNNLTTEEFGMPEVTVTPSFLGSLNWAFEVQKKHYSTTYLEALAAYIAARLGAGIVAETQISQGQLIGRTTAPDICRAALYAHNVQHGVTVCTGAPTLDHVQELLQYSQQPYHVRPTSEVAEGIAEQCLNLEFEELLEKADALGKRGHMERLMLDKIKGVIATNPKVMQEGEPEFLMLFDNDTNEVDIVGLLDACIDQRVVADGTILKYGLGHVFHTGFMEVHENNLTKFPTDEKVAEASVKHWESKGVPCELSWNQRYADMGNFVIRRKEDGKFLKPVGYQAPSLGLLVESEQ
jgi:hypothetical protein